MARLSDTRPNVEFKCRDSNTGSNSREETWEIVAHVNGEVFPVARFFAKGDLYTYGLERNHVPLVDMHVMASHLAELLSTYNKIGKLSEQNYDMAMSAYKPFIGSRQTYDGFMKKVSMAFNSEGWV